MSPVYMDQVGDAKDALKMYSVKRCNTNSMPKSRRVKCPPGVFCISSLGSTLAIIMSVAFLFFLYAVMRPNTIIMPQQRPPQITQTIIPMKGDSRYDMAPQPLRDWRAEPEFYPRGHRLSPIEGHGELEQDSRSPSPRFLHKQRFRHQRHEFWCPEWRQC